MKGGFSLKLKKSKFVRLEKTAAALLLISALLCGSFFSCYCMEAYAADFALEYEALYSLLYSLGLTSQTFSATDDSLYETIYPDQMAWLDAYAESGISYDEWAKERGISYGTDWDDLKEGVKDFFEGIGDNISKTGTVALTLPAFLYNTMANWAYDRKYKSEVVANALDFDLTKIDTDSAGWDFFYEYLEDLKYGTDKSIYVDPFFILTVDSYGTYTFYCLSWSFSKSTYSSYKHKYYILQTDSSGYSKYYARGVATKLDGTRVDFESCAPNVCKYITFDSLGYIKTYGSRTTGLSAFTQYSDTYKYYWDIDDIMSLDGDGDLITISLLSMLMDKISSYEDYMKSVLSVPWIVGNTAVRAAADTWSDDDTVAIAIPGVDALTEAIDGITAGLWDWADTISGVGVAEDEDYVPAIFPPIAITDTDVGFVDGNDGGDDDDDDSVLPVALPDSLMNSMGDITKRFPFCIPFDIVDFAKSLSSENEMEAPRFTASIDIPGINYTWVIDVNMADYEKYIKVFRAGMEILFFIGLLYATRKLIGWQI
jgi:hypothetical protein